ncbi:MAG: hypothetical protein SBU_001082 [Candidatus Syntrophoarchaeum butanivorans]|uniref:DUF2281 domain-containing protein n=1 Tax=Candidatus Syntropharchaeum butanivorans TaxID=1839936 RepID=A0A1F2P3S2_9EURY|nr:MAG: hypothetical protein SBU_001082 [Candidatus Syntrophoarchaeum butanivorans]
MTVDVESFSIPLNREDSAVVREVRGRTTMPWLTLKELVEQLPPDLQHEVRNFVRFLSEKRKKAKRHIHF